MKSLKKLASLLLVFAMVLTFAPVQAAALSDVAEGDKEAVAVLAAFGILQGFEDGTFRGEETITRAQFAAVTMRFMGFENLASTQVDTVFPDVPQSFWGSGYVQAAQQQDVIKGFPDGNFYPDAPVTYEQAVTMIMRTLGYEPMAAETGYPTGYLFAAAQAEVTTGISVPSIGASAPRALVANLIYKALDANLMERNTWGQTDAEYVVNRNITAVERFLNAVKYENAVVAASPFGNGRDGWVKLNETDSVGATFTGARTGEFAINGTDVAFLTGTNIMAYVSAPSVLASQRKVYFAAQASNVASLTIDMAQLNNVAAASGARHTVTYNSDPTSTRTTTTRLADEAVAKIYVNGQEVDLTGAPTVDSVLANYLASANAFGKITFARTGAASSAYDYDTVLVENYNAFTVDSNNTSSQRLNSDIEIGNATAWPQLAYGGTAGRDNRVTLVDLAGAAVAPADVKAGDVVTYKATDNTAVFNYVYGTVGGRTIEGTVDKVGANDRVYVVNGETFVGATSTADLRDNGTFVVDANNYIVDFVPSEDTNVKYGVVESVDGNSIVLYDENGEANVDLSVAATLKINDVSGRSRARLMAHLTANPDSFIAYTVNAQGVVNSVDVVGAVTVTTTSDTATIAALPTADADAGTAITYRGGSRRTLSGAFSSSRTVNVASHTPVWVQMKSGSGTIWVKKDLTQLEDDQYFAAAEMFNWKSSSRTAGAIAIPLAGGVTLRDSNYRLSVITEVRTTGGRAYKDADGDYRTTFYGHGPSSEYEMGDAIAVDGFDLGWSDAGLTNGNGVLTTPVVVILHTNANGEVYNATRVGTISATGFTAANAAFLNTGVTSDASIAIEGISYTAHTSALVPAANINVKDKEITLGTTTYPMADRYSAIVYNTTDGGTWSTGGLRDLPQAPGGSGQSNEPAAAVAIVDSGEVVQIVLFSTF